MRKTLLALLSVCCLGAAAAYMTPESSLHRALADGRQRVKGDLKEFRLVEIESATEVYVFQGPAGFVVTPADDRAPSLLGYGDGAAGSNPEFDYYMAFLSSRVREVAGGSGVPAAHSRPERDPVAPLCTTRWGQMEPYNDECPTDGGARCAAGCVATALAQLMKYHEWPPRGTGSGKYFLHYDTDRQETHEVDLADYIFDWDGMIDSYRDGGGLTGTERQRAAVARLMAAAGAAVEMMYAPGESGAYNEYLGRALAYNFNYTNGMAYEERMCYGLYDWEEMIYSSLKTCGPVAYSGDSDGSGHSFICDGYAGDGMFHMNWGWNGVSDGYFLLDILDPYALNDGNQGNGYTQNQNALLFAKPAAPDEGNPAYIMRSVPGKPLTFAPLDSKLPFAEDADETSFYFGPQYNYGPYTLPGTMLIGVAYESMYDAADSRNSLLSAEYENEIYWGWRRIDFPYDVKLEKGLYRVYVVTSDGESLWPVRSMISKPDFVIGEVDGEGLMTFREAHVLTPRVSDMRMPEEVRIGDGTGLIGVDFFNQRVSVLRGTVRAELIRDGEVVAYGEGMDVTVPVGESETVDYSSPWSTPEGYGLSDIEDGEYRLALGIKNGDGELWLPVSAAQEVNVVNDLSGINNHSLDKDVILWYDLQGRRVDAADLLPGIYIRRSGAETRKVTVK